MVLTRHFKETLLARLERDPEFRRELLKEGIDSLLLGDVTPRRSFYGTTSTLPSAFRNWADKLANLQKT